MRTKSERYIDHTGEKFGKITALLYLGRNKGGRATWLCRCDCGREYIATANTLREAKSCRRCVNTLDLTGRRYGKLVVVSHLYDSKDRHAWLCKCDCGNEVVYASTILSRRRASSCGHCCEKRCWIEGETGIGTASKGEHFLFDPEDWNDVASKSWRISRDGYVLSRHEGKQISLHRMVMKASKGDRVDHINRNKTDCRKINLRFADNSQNMANCTVYSSNKSSGHKNVYMSGNRYRVLIRKHGILHDFGTYTALAEAVTVANEKRKEMFGEFAFCDDYNDPQKESAV